MGEYIVTARRKGAKWWITAITDWAPRNIEIDLSSIINDGMYIAFIVEDGFNAHRHPNDYRIRRENVSRTSKLKLNLAPGGGATMKIELLKI